MERFIKSYPIWMNSEIWKDDGLFKLYHYCLYKASHNEYCWRGIIIRRGEFPMSYRNAARELNWGLDKLIRKKDSLGRLGLIDVRSYAKGTLIRVLNQPEGVPEIRTECTDHRNGSVSEIGTDCTDNRNGSVPIIGTNQEYRDKNNILMAGQPEPAGFSDLWLRYPSDRRNERAIAAGLYADAIRKGATRESVMAALEADKASANWNRENGQYIPGIANWLRKEKWRDHMKPTCGNKEDEIWKTR